MNQDFHFLPDFVSALRNNITYEELFLLVQKLSIALLIGVVIGLEREHSKAKDEKIFAGIRTYPLIALWGFLGAFISSFTDISVFIAFFILFSFLVGISYYRSSGDGRMGMTSEVSAVLVFILGSLVYWNYMQIAAIAAVLIALLLSLKLQLHQFVEKITEEDIFATIKLGLVTIIVLPLLPNESFGPYQLINLRLIWYMIIFIAGISFIGYLLTKFIGYKKGISYTAIFGGFVSSTAVTYSFSKKSKESENLASNYGVGIILATTVVYLKVYLEVLVVNPSLSVKLIIPLALLLICGTVVSIFYWKKISSSAISGMSLKNPFELKSALFFGLVFGVVLFLSKLSQVYFGNNGAYIVSVMAGLTNIDAITLTLSQLAKDGLKEEVAVNSIIIALLANTITKAIIAAFLGAGVLRSITIRGFGILAILSGIILIVLMTF